VYVLVWEFRVRPGAEAAFEQLYGPAGGWVALFASAPGYRGTELLRAEGAPLRYLTIDRWESRGAYLAFRQGAPARYRELDDVGEGLTEAEALVGEFTGGGP
jgi:heme-degrading monooxygenase HmoA